jgi:uncharacterized protein
VTQHRDNLVDAIRGFALLGIVLVNVHYFAVSSADGWFAANVSEFENQLGGFLTSSFFLAKFYLLFSFLFGYSSTYVVKGTPENKRRWLKRSWLLIGFGFFHAVFLFQGDILFVYGVLGLALWLFMFRKDSTIRGWAIALYVLTAVGMFFVTVAAFLADMFEPLSKQDFLTTSHLDQLMVSGSFLDQAIARFELWVTILPGIFILQGPLVFVAFLIGLMAGRKSALSSENFTHSTASKLIGFGLGIGIPVQLLAGAAMVWTFTDEILSFGVFMVSLAVIFLTGGLVSAGIIGVIGKLGLSGKRLEILASAGKNSLSIYLGQSLIMLILFSGWGFGLFGQTSLLINLLIGFLIWLVLSLLAVVNIRAGRRGPMEIVLTTLSSTKKAKPI